MWLHVLEPLPVCDAVWDWLPVWDRLRVTVDVQLAVALALAVRLELGLLVSLLVAGGVGLRLALVLLVRVDVQLALFDGLLLPLPLPEMLAVALELGVFDAVLLALMLELPLALMDGEVVVLSLALLDSVAPSPADASSQSSKRHTARRSILRALIYRVCGSLSVLHGGQLNRLCAHEIDMRRNSS